MGTGITSLDKAYEFLFVALLICMAVLLILCLVRAIAGPRVADRLVAVNMMGTIVMAIIAILTVKMGEGYLADICLIYAMLSFLAVVLLSKIYIGVYREHKEKGKVNAAKTISLNEQVTGERDIVVGKMENTVTSRKQRVDKVREAIVNRRNETEDQEAGK